MSSSTPKDDVSPRSLSLKRVLPILVAVIVVLAAVSAVAYYLSKDETLKICVMMPGDSAFSHLNETSGAMQMAVEDLNKWGGINDHELEIVTRATSSAVDDPAEVFREMDRKYSPLFFVIGSCDLLSAVSPVADEIGVPVFGISSAPGLTEGHTWVFRYYTSAAMEASSALDILETLNVTSLGAIYTNDPHGCGVTDILSETYIATGGEYESETWAYDTAMQASLVANLTDNEAIYVVGPCAVTLQMLRAVRAADYDGQIIASSCLATPQTWALPELEGVYLSSPLLYKSENILAISFSEKFEDRYGFQLTHHAAAGYDIINLIHGVLEGSETSRENLRTQLEAGFVFTGVLGNLMASPGMHDFVFPLFPAHVSGGELWYL